MSRFTRSRNTIRAIVFDFGGVIVDWNPRHLYRKLFPGDEQAMEFFLEEIGFTEWNFEQDLGRPFSTAVEELVAEFPHHELLIRAYDERWEESISGPIHSTVALLEPLKQAGYEIHGLSNWSEEKFALARRRYTVFDLFDTILISGEVKIAKPDPRIFELFLTRTGRSANECLFVDDSPVNVAAATGLGFHVIHFESSDQLARDLNEQGLLDRPVHLLDDRRTGS